MIDSNIKEDVGIFKLFQAVVLIDLWGNQADLSLWPADKKDNPNHEKPLEVSSHILVNDTNEIVKHLLENGVKDRVDILIDNAGYELVCDLMLTDFLISQGVVKNVRFHVKKHPTFVSDATEEDVSATIDFLVFAKEKNVKLAGDRLSHNYENGNLQIKSNWFWNSPLNGWEMPSGLRKELAQSDLIISKGDVNYRRLLGDRHWPYITSFNDLVSYLPVPIAAFRTLKSELIIGLEVGQAQEVAKKDPGWLVNGKWGVVQFSVCL